MSVEIVVPDMGEAGAEATVGRWLKKVGDPVKAGEAVVVLETDKVDLDVAAEADGVLQSIDQPAGQDVGIGEVLGHIEAGAATNGNAETAPAAEPVPAPVQAAPEAHESSKATPVAKRVADDQGVDLNAVAGSGAQGRVTRQDVEKYIETQHNGGPSTPAAQPSGPRDRADQEHREKMSRRRRTIAKRLVEAQQTAAMLTTFNDLDMGAVMDLRKRYKESFQERHGVSLGLSSFFVKAVIGALREFPLLNAEIDGEDLIIKQYYDIGVAIGDKEGLVVPVLRNADRMSFAEIESSIKRFASEIREGKLSLEDLRGGGFTITNGGIFGSLLSTPILNPPQVGILGLHRIEDRPVARSGEVVIRPMMYMALSYDHRIVDGREAVQFLVKLKTLLEEPEMLLIEG